jgi:hypothetical protein
MPNFVHGDANNIYTAALEGDRQALHQLFRIGEQLEEQQAWADSADAFKNSAIAYRRSAGRIQQEAIDQLGDYKRAVLENRLLREWLARNKTSRRYGPIDIPWINKKTLQRALHSVADDPKCKDIFEYLRRSDRGELMTYQRRLSFRFETIFGLNAQGPEILLSYADDLIAEKVIEHSRLFDPAQNPPPALRHTSDTSLQYYRAQAAIALTYFTLCGHEGAMTKAEKSLVQSLEAEVEATNLLLGKDEDCTTLLRQDLGATKSLVDTDDSGSSLFELAQQELALAGYRNRNQWHFEPHYWSDQIGAGLNQLAIMLASESEHLVLELLASSTELRNRAHEGKSTLFTWRRLARSHMGDRVNFQLLHKAYFDMYRTAQSFAEAIHEHSQDHENRRLLLWILIEDYAKTRNQQCKTIAEIWLDKSYHP